MKWHVIYTKPKEEFRAHQNLVSQGFDVFLPTCKVQKRQQYQVELMVQPLFSRYLFIRLSDVSGSWSPIRSTRGVSQLLRFGTHSSPVIVPDFIVDALKKRSGDEEPIHQIFSLGQDLCISKGPFKNLQGIFSGIKEMKDGKSRALLLVSILGATQTLAVPLADLK